MKNSIMIITNNKEISGQMHTHLSSPCTTVIIVPTMSEALLYLAKFDCCLIIIDAAISADDDHQLLSTMTKLKTIPILILSSQTCPVEKLQVLRAGAHAYIGHPYSPEECLAQAQALIQLYCDLKPKQETGHTVSIGQDLVVDPLSRQVLLNGKDIRLTRKEFDLLFCLASNPGQVFSRQQLYNQVWDEHSAYNVDDVVKAQIKTLRQKLSVSGNDYIQNIWGIGYRVRIEPDDE